MLRLYHRQIDHLVYWETWEKEEQTCVHFGRVGERGESLWFSPAQREAIAARLEKDVAKLRERGYSELAPEDHATLIVRYGWSAWGAQNDVAKRQRVEALLDECLGWTGNGECHASEPRSAGMDVLCRVADPLAALDMLVDTLRREQLLSGAIIAYAIDEDDDFRVLWPADYTTAFTIGE
ncbi:MAG TPA: hypothetical protein VL096_15345 [Pirellulaceae bacterium]|nr:hypothetical protein [Pirellulaceae bacterium]